MADFTNIVQDKSKDELLKMVYEFDQWNTDILNAVQTELSKRNISPKDVAERSAATWEPMLFTVLMQTESIVLLRTSPPVLLPGANKAGMKNRNLKCTAYWVKSGVHTWKAALITRSNTIFSIK